MKSPMERLADELSLVTSTMHKLPSQSEIDASAEEYRAAVALRNQRKAKYASRANWVRYVLSVPAWNRVEAFAEIQHKLSDRVYWRLLGRLFVHTVPSVSHIALWQALFLSVRSGREFFAGSDQDRILWNSLPKEIIAYTGQGKSRPQGRFYSLDRETAELYVRQHHGDGVVQTRVFSKSDCLYYGGHHSQLTYVFNMGNIAALTSGVQ